MILKIDQDSVTSVKREQNRKWKTTFIQYNVIRRIEKLNSSKKKKNHV